MRRHRRFLCVLLVLLSTPVAAWACLWDYDTLKQERSRFPSTLELITGKFLRHSPEFYQWRIQDRLKKIDASSTDLTLYDDLAVAYEKTGQHDKAIETILAKEKMQPGLYTTYSNLGTFHILAGDFEKGLPYIDKALAIDPDAHFGRERYQKWLVEYALTRRKDGKLRFPLRLTDAEVEKAYNEQKDRPVILTFAHFLRSRLGKEPFAVEDYQQAVKGVLGMMRFANHSNPLLLEALGELLSTGSTEIDAKRLAARCYLKASYEVADEEAKSRYRAIAKQILSNQTVGPDSHHVLKLEDLETSFRSELAAADGWYAELRDREIGWIREDKNVDAEFDRLYTAEPSVSSNDPTDKEDEPIESGPNSFVRFLAAPLTKQVVLGVGFFAVVLLGIMVVRSRRRAA